MEYIIVTGLSGAGKSQAINSLEDMGVYCVDNMPPSLFSQFSDICAVSMPEAERVALVIDSRSKSDFKELLVYINNLKDKGNICKILFLDCDADVLANRYKETRRRHPLLDEANGSAETAIRKEIELLSFMKAEADYVIDTSLMSPIQLRERVKNIFSTENEDMLITCLSFGFKYGIPKDADIVMDVRCLPNPFYVPELKHKTGKDKEVRDYVMNSSQSKELLEKFWDMISFLIPNYKSEGKSQLVIAFGCTGGKHRSITFAELLNQKLLTQGKNTNVYHRDILRK